MICWSADLKSKTTEDIISIGSFIEVLVLNHYVLVRKIFTSCGYREGNRHLHAGREGVSIFKRNSYIDVGRKALGGSR
ncbi:hypothetical protein Tco_1490579 [Tanacetum coccineum]